MAVVWFSCLAMVVVGAVVAVFLAVVLFFVEDGMVTGNVTVKNSGGHMVESENMRDTMQKLGVGSRSLVTVKNSGGHMVESENTRDIMQKLGGGLKVTGA